MCFCVRIFVSWVVGGRPPWAEVTHLPEMRFCVARNLTFCWEEIHSQKLCKSSLQVKISPREDVLCNCQKYGSDERLIERGGGRLHGHLRGLLRRDPHPGWIYTWVLSAKKILNSLKLFFSQPHIITFLCFLLPAFTYDGFLYLLLKVRTEIWSTFVWSKICSDLSVGQLLLHLRCRPTWWWPAWSPPTSALRAAPGRRRGAGASGASRFNDLSSSKCKFFIVIPSQLAACLFVLLGSPLVAFFVIWLASHHPPRLCPRSPPFDLIYI